MRSTVKDMESTEVYYYVGFRNRCEVLHTSADIIQNSSIVQHSLTPLNLEMCQCSVFEGQIEPHYSSFTYSNEVISSEEKCRKGLSKSKSILYTLNLDLPGDGERRLRSHSRDMKLSCDLDNRQEAKIRIEDDPEISYPQKISIDDNFYADTLYSLVSCACERNDDCIKMLKWFLNFNPSDKPLVDRLPCAVISQLLNFARRQEYDEKIVRNMRRLEEMKWIITDNPSKPELFCNLLYYLYQNSKSAKRIIQCNDFVNYFISFSSFQLAEDVLKLKDAPRFNYQLLCYYAEKISHSRIPIYSKKKIPNMSLRRRTLLLQMLWIHLVKSGNRQEGVKFLRLIWRSVPDSFLTSTEIAEAFEERFVDVYNFYLEAVSTRHSYAFPRTLQHYSRISIRRRLSQNGHWLPDGIKELGLPLPLQTYLNLQECKNSL